MRPRLAAALLLLAVTMELAVVALCILDTLAAHLLADAHPLFPEAVDVLTPAGLALFMVGNLLDWRGERA